MKLNLGFFGTPNFAANLMEAILHDKNIPVKLSLVVTQPDQPVGRKKILTPSPVKLVAEKFKINVYEMLHVSRYMLRDIDLCLVYAFGEKIPADLLEIPKYGFWNIHPSLLPKYRGPAPMAYPLILGDQTTGVTIIKLDNKIDHGPIIAQEKYTIQPEDTSVDLENHLTDLGFELFKKLISTNPADLGGDQLKLIQQDNNFATYTRQLTREDGFIPLSVLKKALNNEPLTENEIPSLIKEYFQKNKQPISTSFNQFQLVSAAQIIYNYFRGLAPWPGLWTLIEINQEPKRLKLTKMSLDMLHASRFMLHIDKVQLEGKTEIDFESFNRVYKILY